MHASKSKIISPWQIANLPDRKYWSLSACRTTQELGFVCTLKRLGYHFAGEKSLQFDTRPSNFHHGSETAFFGLMLIHEGYQLGNFCRRISR